MALPSGTHTIEKNRCDQARWVLLMSYNVKERTASPFRGTGGVSFLLPFPLMGDPFTR